MFHLRHHLMDDEEIRKILTGVPTILRGIELILDFFRIHGSQLTKRETNFLKAFENEVYGTSTNTVPSLNGAESATILAQFDYADDGREVLHLFLMLLSD